MVIGAMGTRATRCAVSTSCTPITGMPSHWSAKRNVTYSACAASRLPDDPSDAEDLTSETFARMLRGLVGFRGEASFRNWLYQIARNAVRNHRRSAAYRRVVPLSGAMVADEPTPPEPSDSPQRSEAVLELLSKLPPRYRRVLELRFLEGRTIEQTAADLAVTVSNAKVLQHRALRKAAHIMEEGRIEVRTGPS